MEQKIPFNKPLVLGTEKHFIDDAILRGEFSAQGYYSKQCEKRLEEITTADKVLLTSSCTHALEMSAILMNIKAGDEIIMSPFNFVSAANAFVLRGAKIVFVDIKLDTLNIDENLIEDAITEKTRAILVMHYSGVPCEMDTIMNIAKNHDLLVVEDAAHCIGAEYKGRPLGSIGHFGTLSFHATKNIHCGEGGALLVNDIKYLERAEIIREKGTNRKKFVDGEVDKYTWVDIGSSYLMSELSAAFLFSQLREVEKVNTNRRESCKIYDNVIRNNDKFSKMQHFGNGHSYFILFNHQEDRARTMKVLKDRGISAYFHYLPLHISKAGKEHSRIHAGDANTLEVSKGILRLPMYYDLERKEIEQIAQVLNNFV